MSMHGIVLSLKVINKNVTDRKTLVTLNVTNANQRPHAVQLKKVSAMSRLL